MSLSAYRKCFSTQHALIALIEKWKVSLDNKGFAGAILMDLSKAFDTIYHELLIAKLHTCGFNRNALMIIMDYLSDRWHRTRINTACSSMMLLLSLSLKNMLQRLEHDSILAITWFECNYMKLNEGKCHLLLPGKNIEHILGKSRRFLNLGKSKRKFFRSYFR